MFISKKEAEARLHGGRNLFREANATSPDEQDQPSLPDAPCSILEEDDHALNKESEVDTTEVQLNQSEAGEDDSDSRGNDSDNISLPHLDHLLFPKKNGRAQYKGKIESQVAIGETNLILGREQTARVFDLSTAQTEAYGYGQPDVPRNDPNRPVQANPILKARLRATKDRLGVMVADRLEHTLNSLTLEKINGIKRATNITKVAKDLAVIMEKCSDVEKNEAQTTHFHVYTPELNVENNYQTVNVGPSLPSHSHSE